MISLHLQGMISLNSNTELLRLHRYKDLCLCFVFLVRADIIDYGNAFNLTMYLKNETEYIVWDRLASSIAYVRDMLSGNAAIYLKFQVSGMLIFLGVRDHFKHHMTFIFICNIKFPKIIPCQIFSPLTLFFYFFY